jgi:hypothetical protein
VIYLKTVLYQGLKYTSYNENYYVRGTGEKMIWLHKVIWENHNNCKIPKGYVVHHKDHDKLNNDISNLVLMRSNEHRKIHTKGKNNPRYGVKEDKQHAIERGKKITLGKLKPHTEEMLIDIKKGISRRNFVKKYGTEGIWNRYKHLKGLG